MSTSKARFKRTFLFWGFITLGAGCGLAAPPVETAPAPADETSPVPQTSQIEARPAERPTLGETEVAPPSKGTSVKRLALSTSVEADTHVALNPQTSFAKGTQTIYASFDVNGFHQGATIRVLWYRNEKLIHEHDLECMGEKRHSVNLTEKKGFPVAQYAVEVEVEGDVFVRRQFDVGKKAGSGPTVSRAALGTALGKNNLPKKERKSFNPGVKVIKCGVQFADLPQNSHVTIKWISAVNGSELMHESDTVIETGGSGATSAVYRPGGKMAKGAYRVEILFNSEKVAELPFTIK